MPARLIKPAIAVRAVDLADADAVARVEAWLAARADATPFHRPAWINAVARGCDQRAQLLVAENGAGAIAGLLPLNVIHSPLFGRALVSTGFAVDGGILADDAAVAQALAQAGVDLAARWSCPSVELRGGMTPGLGWTTRADAYLGFAGDLAEDDEAQLRAIPRKHRAELRKGLAQDYEVRFGSDAEIRAIHYRLYRRSVHNLGTPVFPRALFDAVLDGFGAKAEIVLVAHRGEPLTTVLSLIHGETYLPYWQGADINARAARSNEVAYFELMRRARTLGLRRFDFGRSKFGSGPAAYKKNWGFEGRPLAYHVHAQPGHEPRDINPLSPQYRRKIALWKALPAGLVDRIGPWIARGLG